LSNSVAVKSMLSAIKKKCDEPDEENSEVDFIRLNA
jgi:hypothetical protein